MNRVIPIAPPRAGLFLLSAYEKSHHETVMAEFNFTSCFARLHRRRLFFVIKGPSQSNGGAYVVPFQKTSIALEFLCWSRVEDPFQHKEYDFLPWS